jgi:3-phosphoshikimate 1-carboxyvinyltransferase
MSTTYPETLTIEPLKQAPNTIVRVPGSKSITNRALVLAALSDLGSTLVGALRSEDTEIMIEALRALGFDVKTDWTHHTLRVSRPSGDRIIPAREASLFCGNSGTSMRFLTALVSLGHGRYRLDGVPRMRERPISDLLGALQQLGVRAVSETHNGCPPVVIDADGIKGNYVTIKGDTSSQFLSALLMVAAFCDKAMTIQVSGPLVSKPYVDMTQKMMLQWGLYVRSVDIDGEYGYVVTPRKNPRLSNYEIEPDASAASYFFGAAAITGGKVEVLGLTRGAMQGDIHFVDGLEKMGCHITYGEKSITVEGGSLHGIDIDMNDISDTVMTLAAVACFAEGPTTIRNVAHIRHKETDRLAALATELRKLGVQAEELADGLKITPGPLHGAEIDTYNDHRMAMSLALVGLKVPGVVIRNPGCVAKTYPDFFRDLEKLR